MTYTATISDFRNNLSDYVDIVNRKKGRVDITNSKKNEVVATLVPPKNKKEFDWDSYMRFLKTFKPIFIDKDIEDIKRLRKADRKRASELNW